MAGIWYTTIAGNLTQIQADLRRYEPMDPRIVSQITAPSRNFTTLSHIIAQFGTELNIITGMLQLGATHIKTFLLLISMENL